MNAGIRAATRSSPVMDRALSFMAARGGGLQRERGGFWIGLDEQTHGEVWFTAHTINALLRRKLVTVTRWQGTPGHFDRAAGRFIEGPAFPVEVKPT